MLQRHVHEQKNHPDTGHRQLPAERERVEEHEVIHTSSGWNCWKLGLRHSLSTESAKLIHVTNRRRPRSECASPSL